MRDKRTVAQRADSARWDAEFTEFAATCPLGPRLKASATEMHEAYREWRTREGKVGAPMSIQGFGRRARQAWRGSKNRSHRTTYFEVSAPPKPDQATVN